jgi:RNA polymerase sigma-70 factor (sigma-E family)
MENKDEHQMTSSVANQGISSETDEPVITRFTGLYRSEQPSMVRVAYQIVGSTAEAEDLVHDAFLELHRKWSSVDNPGGYLRTAVVNRCISRMRRRRLEWTNREPTPTPVPAPALDEMWQALKMTTPRQRAELVLRYYDDLTVNQIAEVMQTRPGTVTSLIHRGLKKLERELKS